MLNLITPHGKWSIHSTYSENNRMLTLSRGGYPVWLSPKDAAELDVADNDWVEVHNDNGVFVQRAIVSARIPRGHGLHLPRHRAHRRHPEIPAAGEARGHEQLAHPGAAQAGADDGRLRPVQLCVQLLGTHRR